MSMQHAVADDNLYFEYSILCWKILTGFGCHVGTGDLQAWGNVRQR